MKAVTKDVKPQKSAKLQMEAKPKKQAKPKKAAKNKSSDEDEFGDFGGEVDFQPDELNVNLNEEEEDDGFYAGDDF
jgi:hypothetical protein